MRALTTTIAVMLIVAAILWATIALAKWQARRRARAQHNREQEHEPLEILQRKLVQGEITDQEYMEREAALRSSWRER